MDSAKFSLAWERAERKRWVGVDGGGARVSDRVVSLLVAQLNMASSVESFEGFYLGEEKRIER